MAKKLEELKTSLKTVQEEWESGKNKKEQENGDTTTSAIAGVRPSTALDTKLLDTTTGNASTAAANNKTAPKRPETAHPMRRANATAGSTSYAQQARAEAAATAAAAAVAAAAAAAAAAAYDADTDEEASSQPSLSPGH